jgi:predicted transcriptional regulator
MLTPTSFKLKPEIQEKFRRISEETKWSRVTVLEQALSALERELQHAGHAGHSESKDQKGIGNGPKHKFK